MEATFDSLDVQVNMLKGQTPNQQVFVANEDLALTSEVAIDRPDFIEVEKRTVIKKNCIINEKYVIHKSTGTAISVDQGQQTLSIDTSLVGCEFSFPGSQGSGLMEIASQGSSMESKMEICSQESLMEYSSQETDIPTEPVNVTINSNEATCDDKLAKENGSLVHSEHIFVDENFYAEVSSTSDKPIVSQDEFSENKYCDSCKEEEISRNFPAYGDEKELENEAEFSKEQSISKVSHLKRRSSIERLLLAREESVTAREEACISREKALKKREAAIANQKDILKDCVDNVIPLPKRLKLKKVFEYM